MVLVTTTASVGDGVTGLALGPADGLAEGAAVDPAEGEALGLAFGLADGPAEGEALGLAFGLADGPALGLADGLDEGTAVASGVLISVGPHITSSEHGIFHV